LAALTIRETIEQNEELILSPYAAKSARCKARARAEAPCPVRAAFQRDRDRIIHCKAFRRLKHKTQVFLSPESDHYRTRLTHTLEVAQIARTMARALRLNEDLTEAVALGHDLGHTPFGHAGERVLQKVCPLGFKHNLQSVRVLERLENGGQGLNLTPEVLDGVACHTGDRKALTLEGRLVHYADRIAYINHDIDDAIRGGILSEKDIPAFAKEALGATHSERIAAMVRAVIEESAGRDFVGMRADTELAMDKLRAFLFDTVYRNSAAKAEEGKAMDMLARLYEYFIAHADMLPKELSAVAEREGVERAVLDYVAGMTDRYAAAKYKELFIPSFWMY